MVNEMSFSGSQFISLKKQAVMGLFFMVVCVFCAGCYFGNVFGGFILDDSAVLLHMEGVKFPFESENLSQFIFSEGLFDGRPLAKLSFLISDYTWPQSPAAMKFVNSAIHILFGLILFWWLFVLFEGKKTLGNCVFCVVAATLWLLSPAQVSTVLYVVQRMAQLSSFFIICGMFVYTYCRFRINSNSFKNVFIIYSLVFVFGVLSVLSKPSGAFLLLAIPLLEFSGILPKLKQSTRINWFKIAAISCVLLFIILFAYQCFVKWPSYEGRSFDGLERLNWQGYIVFLYLKAFFLPDIYQITVFNDHLEYFQQLGEIPAWSWWLVHVAIVALALRLKKRNKIFCFGILFFYCGHIIESTLLPLELMFEHRNYLPSIGLSLAASSLLLRLAKLLDRKISRLASIMILFLPVMLSGILLMTTASLWGSHRILAPMWSYERPNSVRAQLTFIRSLQDLDFDGMALGKSLDVSEEMPGILSFRLLSLRLGCMSVSKDSVKKTIEELPNDFGSVLFTNDLAHQASLLLEPSISTCIIEYLGRDDFDSMLRNIKLVPRFVHNPRYYGFYLNALTNYYGERGNFQLAVMNAEELSGVQITVDTALKAADLFYSGGQWQEAKKYYQIALSRHNSNALGSSLEIKIILSSLEHVESLIATP